MTSCGISSLLDDTLRSVACRTFLVINEQQLADNISNKCSNKWSTGNFRHWTFALAQNVNIATTIVIYEVFVMIRSVSSTASAAQMHYGGN